MALRTWVSNQGDVHWETEGHLELAARGTTSVEKVLSVVARTTIKLQR
jgi:hypothetical protein